MIKKVHVNQLCKGMFVCDTDRKWIELPFFRQKFKIVSTKQINILQQYCTVVVIDTLKGVDVINEAAAEITIRQHREQTENKPAAAAVNLEKNAYKKCYEHNQTVLSEVLNDVRLGRCVDSPKVKSVVEDLTINIIKDSQAMIGLIQLKDKNDTLARKSVNVCILALAFGKHIGIPKNKMHVLGLGALLHDIGMVQIPDRILLKKQPLTSSERAIMEKHTAYGLVMLAKTPEMDVDVLKIVHSHHERIDGNGYPQRLQGKEIGLLVRMTTIASVYEALTRERFYTETLSPIAALQYLYRSGKTLFDGLLVEKFIQALGIYPVGCVVELNTGEIGIVINVHLQDRLHPVLRMVTNGQKQLLAQDHVVDLASMTANKIGIVKALAVDDPVIKLLLMLHQQSDLGF